MIIEVLTEGASDVPALREILTRRFNLVEHEDFHIHPHRGKGNLPADPSEPPSASRRGLLDQLPAKLRGFGRYMDDSFLVLVVVDADDEIPENLVENLEAMKAQLVRFPPRVAFLVVVEETESWFIADLNAMSKAFPEHSFGSLQWIAPDSVVGAEKISPHLDLADPKSPSLRRLIDVVEAAVSGE
jgi:hypothetical protein